ncbi:MAG: AAA family ATPase [Desulfobacteraceae bacterium]|nr:AAA family ATPase [Desulfobacteraceae bacterium]
MYLDKLQIHQDKFPVKDHYPFDLKIFQNTPSLTFDKAITFFIGENGTGKSTLLKAMAYRTGIHIWQSEFQLRIKRNPHEENLYKTISVHWKDVAVPGSFFGSQIFTHFARNLEEWAVNDPEMLKYFGGKSLITQSHGQSLMSYFQSRYNIKGLYFLDEPETALSPSSLLGLLKLLIKINKLGHAQFFIATHSPFLLACPDSQIFSFNGNKIKPVKYKETDYYKTYKNFMDRPEDYY